LIEVKNLTKTYGDHTVVNHLSFKIEPGKIYGFLGPNGAGKSTTMNMLTGCLAPTEGQVLIDGHDILTDAVAAKRKIGYLPEIPPVYPDMTPEEYLRFVAEAKGIRPAEIWEQVYRVMEETDIIDMRHRLIKNLSKGYKQRVGIAQAMLGDPRLIILDEPTVGLDPRQITEIRELILRLGQTRTIILSSHILAEVSAVCEQVMIINRGNLVASDTLENIRRDNTPDNRIDMTVRANPEAIETILKDIVNVLSFEITVNPDEPNLYDVSIEVEEGADIREKLFFAFADKRYAVRRLAKAELSLEEIFLQLTDSGYGDDEDDEDDERSENENNDIDDDDEDEDDEDEDEEEYVPLFGGRRHEDDEDEEDEE
jgi:ABC-2 type transport system ATP-binding protein